MPKFGKIVAPPSTVESCEIVKEYYQKRIWIIHIQRLKKQLIDFIVFDDKKIIVKNYQNHNGTIVGFIT